jgi:hypothetical protein
MKQKSHDTISLLNPHATYLAVSLGFPLNYVEKEAASRLDKRSGGVPADCLSDYSSLCFDDGSLHFPSAECPQP